MIIVSFIDQGWMESRERSFARQPAVRIKA